MTEHEVCKGCKWNNYPVCNGIIMFDGNPMNIEKLRPTFQCERKDLDNIDDFSIKPKSPLELKIEELEARIRALES